MSDRRVNVTFSEGTFRMLEELAQRKGKSMSEIVRDAVTLEKWIQDAHEEGARILVERDGERRELILR